MKDYLHNNNDNKCVIFLHDQLELSFALLMRRVLVQLLLKSLSQDEAISFIDVVYKCENKKRAPYMTHYCRVVTDIYIQLKVVSHTIMTDFFYFVIGVSLVVLQRILRI